MPALCANELAQEATPKEFLGVRQEGMHRVGRLLKHSNLDASLQLGRERLYAPGLFLGQVLELSGSDPLGRAFLILPRILKNRFRVGSGMSSIVHIVTGFLFRLQALPLQTR